MTRLPNRLLRLPARLPALAGGLLFAAALVSAVPARAELGDGIPVGDGHLKLGVDLSLRYDSEAGVGLFSGSNVANPGDLIAVGGAEFQLNLRNETTFIKFNGAVNYNQYTGIIANTRGLSYFGANAVGEFDFNQNRPFGVDVSENFTRSDSTTNPVFGLGVIDLDNSTRIRARYRPGGGALEFGLSGEFDASIYTSQLPVTANSTATNCGSTPANCPADAEAYNSLAFLAKVDGTWRLLPKTGLLLEAGYGTQQYLSTAIPNVNAQPIVANLGFGTLLTTRLTFQVKAGYEGISFADHIAMHNDFDATGEIGYHFTDQFFGRVGGGQLLYPVGGGQHYYDDDRVFLELGYKPLPVLAFSLLGAVDFFRFGVDTTDPTGGDRNDQLYGATFSMDWTAVRWLHVGASFNYTNRVSNVADTNNPDDATAYNYQRYIAMLSLSFLF